VRGIGIIWRLAIVAALVAAVSVGIRMATRGAADHGVDDADAPGSVDQWPPVPRRPED
jgi:hypothetical protein